MHNSVTTMATDSVVNAVKALSVATTFHKGVHIAVTLM